MGAMFETLRNAFKIPDLRKKMIFTLLMLVVYRLGIVIPVPGIDPVRFTQLFESMGGLGQMMNIFSGGALGLRFVSIFSMGITPYINSSIIMQLLTVAIPALERMQKEGESGRKKIQKYVRYLTLGLALLQAFFYWVSTRSATTSALPGWLNAFVVIFSFTAGTAFIMWIGEQINEKGIGNGISLIIFAGIVSRLPQGAQALYQNFLLLTQTRNIIFAVLAVIGIGLVFVAVIALVVYVQSAERRIPVQYAKKVVGRKMYGGQSTYLPIKVNQSGVIPVIFAISILTLPPSLINMIAPGSAVAMFFNRVETNPFYYVFYALLILGFTFFYSMIQFNPVEVANNLQKNGGFIPGIRPGRPTADFVKSTSRRLSWFDGLFLVLIVLLPTVLGAITKIQGIWFGGTAVLILVGVAMDLVNQLEAQMVMRHYKGFLD